MESEVNKIKIFRNKNGEKIVKIMNPWLVESIQAFSCLKCPECEFHTKKDTVFENHATENHPLSFVLFSKKKMVKQELDDGNLPNLAANIKEEPRTEIDEFDQVSRSSSQDQENNLYEDPTRICEVSFDENEPARNVPKKPRIEGILNESFEESAEAEFEKEFAKVKQEFLANTFDSTDHSGDNQKFDKVSQKERKKRLSKYIVKDSETGLDSCNFCQKKFHGSHKSVRLQKLMDHIDTSHLKVKSYECRFCGKKYSGRSQMSVHVKLKHPEYSNKRLLLPKPRFDAPSSMDNIKVT